MPRIGTFGRSVALIAVISSFAALTRLLASAKDKDAADKAIDARQGFMDVVSWEAGPLFGMAKGEVAYDAATAQANADNLNSLVQYNFARLFVEGSSKADKAGKTRALPEIWSDMAGLEKALGDFRSAVANVAAQAGKGQAEMAAAVGEMGKACGNCHNSYRAKEF